MEHLRNKLSLHRAYDKRYLSRTLSCLFRFTMIKFRIICGLKNRTLFIRLHLLIFKGKFPPNVIDYVDQYTRRLLRKRKRNILLNDLIENPD